MFATPISGRDIALGNLVWIAARLLLIATVFTVVIVAVRGRHVAAHRAGHPGRGPDRPRVRGADRRRSAATQRRRSGSTAIFRFGITPLFLFSGTFYPVESLPPILQPLAWLTPLCHGVVLARGLSLGTIGEEPTSSWPLVHLVILLGFVVVGTSFAVRTVSAEAGARMTALPLTSALLIGSRRSLRLVERNLYVYRHGWLVILSGFFEPLFYLLGIGFGLGALIGDVPGPDGEPIPYQLFVAPALLATAAMNGAINESTFNFFFKLNYNKTFTSILATPLSPGDIAVGELVWALIRGGLYAIGFMVVMVVLGPRRVAVGRARACPAALLVGFAFGAVGMAATSFMKTWQDFDLIQLVVLPLFLFSATFYPIETYPEPLRVVVQLTPLYQGVDLIRSLTVGAISPVLLVHVAYLAVMGFAGLFVVSRRLDKLLLRRDRSGRAGGPHRRDRRVPPLSAAGRLARAGRPREGRPVPRRDVLGPAGAGLRRPGRADPARGPGAGGPRRQSDRPGLHRRRLGRLPVRGAPSRRPGRSAGRRAAPTTG